MKVVETKNVPFMPEFGQVVYAEAQYNKRLNSYIQKHYSEIESAFAKEKLQFCYMPFHAKEVIKYNAPFVNDNRCEALAKSAVATITAGYEKDMPASLVFVNAPKEKNASYIALPKYWWLVPKRTFAKLAKQIGNKVGVQRSFWQVTQFSDEEDVQFSLKKNATNSPQEPVTYDADEHFSEDVQKIIGEIKASIEKLRNHGVNTAILHSIIDESEQLSRLYITRDYRILLPDYNNLEIKMTTLTKAVYLLFLRHPEGIIFKELSDYYAELLEIYQNLNPLGSLERQYQSISDLTNPLHNSINEKCARIRKAFVAEFDEHLAKNYYVFGARGEAKRIALAPSKITWEK